MSPNINQNLKNSENSKDGKQIRFRLDHLKTLYKKTFEWVLSFMFLINFYKTVTLLYQKHFTLRLGNLSLCNLPQP